VEGAGGFCILLACCAAKRLDSLFDAADHVAKSQHVLDSKPRHGILGAGGFEARYGESDAVRVAPPN
jgi:hypothetical protein